MVYSFCDMTIFIFMPCDACNLQIESNLDIINISACLDLNGPHESLD